ncbi:MAG: AMP-binding enzyme [Acutalibacter sp.]
MCWSAPSPAPRTRCGPGGESHHRADQGHRGHRRAEKEIQNYVKKNTAPYKYPRIVEFREDLPKTISGKIRRVELKG